MSEESIPIRNVMLKASLLMMAILLSSRFMGYLFHLIFVRSFDKESYGTFVFVWSLSLFICGLIPHIPYSVSRYLAFYRGEADKGMMGSTVRTGIVLNMLLLAVAMAASWLAYALGLMGLDWASFLFMASVLAFTSVGNLFGGILTGYRRPEVAMSFNFIQNLTRVLAIALAAAVASSLYGVMGLVAISYLLSTLILVSYVARAYGFGSSYDAGLSRKLLDFGAFNVVNTTANNLMSWTSIFLLQFFLGSAVVAVYNVSFLASSVSLLFFTAVLQIFMPVVSELFGAKKLDRIGYLTSYLFESFFLLLLPVFLAVLAFAGELIVLFVNADYASGAIPLKILALSQFFFGLMMLFNELINAEGKPQVNARNIGFGAVLNVVLNLALIPSYGMAGSAVATLVSSVVVFALAYRHVRGVIKLKYSRMRVLKIVSSSLIALAAAYAVKAAVTGPVVSLALSLTTLVVVYVAALMSLKSLRGEDAMLADVLITKAGIPPAVRARILALLGRGLSG